MSTKEITTALCKFMKEVPTLSIMTTAKIPTKNGRGFEFEFAELGYICSVINPVLAKNGLHIMHINRVVNGVEYLVSTLYHESGEVLPSSEKVIPTGLNANPLYSYGSAMTYFRRYVTLSMLNLWHGQDDAGMEYEPKEETKEETKNFANPIVDMTTYAKKTLKNALSDKTKKKLLKELVKLRENNKKEFIELEEKFIMYFQITGKMSDAIQETKHLDFIENCLGRPLIEYEEYKK